MTDLSFPPPADQQGFRHITPTDVAQFIRLDQCERYLRLRLHARAFGSSFMRSYGVTPQSIPALLTRSGSDFELTVEAGVRAASQAQGGAVEVYNFATDQARPTAWKDDNEEIVERVRRLQPGESTILLQPRVQAHLNGWLVRGDVDILRVEREPAGGLSALIADIKSSTSAKLEHRLQVAFYHEMLAALCREHEIELSSITMGVLYRGPAEGESGQTDAVADAERDAQRELAEQYLGTGAGLLEIIERTDGLLGAVEDLVTGDRSTANRVARAAFDDVPFHLTYKCDGCLYNELCMKWCAEHDDLSLVPHLRLHDKSALQRGGVVTTSALAAVKQPVAGRPDQLAPPPGGEALARRLSATWPIGPRLDELIHRARHYRKWSGDEIAAITYIPSKGYGSLPYSDETQNPNLVRIFVDAQHDYLQDRLYLLGALLVGNDGGQPDPERRRHVVSMTDVPPNTPEIERDLIVDWLERLLEALAEVAAPDENGEPNAPIHLIFYNSFEQRLVLDALSRNFTAILGATHLYDFMTQIAAYDSPLVTFLEREIAELKNYPMVCQSLQAVAAYRGFDWNSPEPYRRLFRVRMFDFWGKLERDETASWYTSRARFNSQIPLEYAYAAWGDLDVPAGADADDYARFRGASTDLIRRFHARRLDALEHIAGDFKGNKQTVKTPFRIPDLATTVNRAETLAQALDEFVTIERHVTLSGWRAARLAPPERRVLSGETLVVRYLEEDQEPGVAEKNRDNERRRLLRERYRQEYMLAHPDAARINLPKEQNDESRWTSDGMQFWMRIETDGVGCGLDELLGLTTFKDDERVVMCPRWAVDSRLAVAEQYEFTPTPKQMLYGKRATLRRIVVQRDANGRALHAKALVEPVQAFRGRNGYVFGTIEDLPLQAGRAYSLDSDPNDWNGSFQAEMTEALVAGAWNTTYQRLVAIEDAKVAWPPEAAEAQARFYDGLVALHEAGVAGAHAFEPSKQEYISRHGDAPVLLVQGPPGTGKSYSTAFALLARIQGAMAAGISYRALLACKTHAATDVLLGNVRDAQAQVAAWFDARPNLCRPFFDARLLDVPLMRLRPRGDVAAPIIPVPRDSERTKGEPAATARIGGQQWCVVATTPAGIRGAIKERWSTDLFSHTFIDAVVLDEASQMSLPEAIMASLALKPEGHLIVVGDHRQMPPIVAHDWDNESRRTFQEYQTYASLFDTFRAMDLPIIRFQESFRLHADMAEFLRREIYSQDGIPFHSHRHDLLEASEQPDPFVASVLESARTIVVVVHDEAASQHRNAFERELIRPVLEALSALGPDGLDARQGLGVVVPHRAQRADLQEMIPCLSEVDPLTGVRSISAVDTVERFQGGERLAIVVSATESDPQYLLVSSKFLLDPRRLTVALSRAKRKIVLVASRSVFNVFSADEETFENAQLWKNLLRHTCTDLVWSGERDGVAVEVWGNVPGIDHAAANHVASNALLR
ncbi:MAG TPA: AAA domain-containing protein [Thermomicrobiales bacterium]|nr:AAA domain-containing protein [Thermomicrobiales bacterium]